MEPASPVARRKRGLSSDRARAVRQRGHDDALAFALAIGLERDYQNDHAAKKDVIDLSGDAHSVKSGEKKWQVFLYGANRIGSDDAFAVMNGIGALMLQCIAAFPPTFAAYQADKASAKEQLRAPMRELAARMQERPRLRAFLSKAMFNGGEVQYLTVKHDGVFHVFLYTDVLDAFAANITVTNSQARRPGDTPEQKVVWQYAGHTIAELEMRNDSEVHYREVRFNMLKPKVMALLLATIPVTARYSDEVQVHGNAARKFGRWTRKALAA
jgi:hypothetical protein